MINGATRVPVALFLAFNTLLVVTSIFYVIPVCLYVQVCTLHITRYTLYITYTCAISGSRAITQGISSSIEVP